jgi:hypothetical protein
MTQTLLTLFPSPDDLLGLEPEDLGGVILELAPGVMQDGMFYLSDLTRPLFSHSNPSYQHNVHHQVTLALAEAITWLVHQGLLIKDPEQPAGKYRQTRRAQHVKTRTDVERFRKGRILPTELLQPTLTQKVWPMFLRGDHDVAVFQAFKEVEVAVRKAANVKGAAYPDDLVGKSLMREALHPHTGTLTNTTAPIAEREAEAHLFAGAIGHAKNPVSHRDVTPTPQEAARLVIFASHLLAIVEQR